MGNVAPAAAVMRPEDVSILKEPGASGGEARHGQLVEYGRRKVAAVLHIDGAMLEQSTHLMLYGMDSLLFFRLLESIATQLRIAITPSEAITAFQHLTLDTLAALLARALETQSPQDGPTGMAQALGAPIVPDPANRHKPFALTDIQYAYWIGQSGAIGWGNVPCHAYAEFDRTDQGLDFDRLSRALRQVIKRHDMLRAVVLPSGEQQILEHVPDYAVQVRDLRGTDGKITRQALEAIRREMTEAGPRSDTWPLFEFRASRFGDGMVRFHISLDLLVFDGQSIQILFRDLARCYENPESLPAPLSLSFRDYVTCLAGLPATEHYQRSRQYWLDKLPTMPQPPELPMVKDMATVSDFHFSGRQCDLSPEQWRRFKEQAARAGLTPSAALLTAYAKVLGAWNRHDSFTLNLTQYNRHGLHPEVTEILGDFTSILLVAVRNHSADSFAAAGRRLQREILEGMEHRAYSGIEVMRELARRQEGNAPYIVPYVFTSITGVGGSIDQDGQEEPWESLMGECAFMSVRTPQVVLDHQIRERHGALSCRWDVVEELFPQGLIDDMFAAYRSLLGRLADDASAWERPAEMALPAHQESRRLARNSTDGECATDLLHTLFARKAQQQPDAPAIITPRRTLGYGELDHRARHLARELVALGAGPNRLVAVVMHKGWEQVVAVLGILYAGAAYLPIDAEFPEARIRHLLANGEAELVVTQPEMRERMGWPQKTHVCVVESTQPAATDLPVPETRQTGGDLAYVIYTSGSTGMPKGVMIDHHGAVNTVLDVNARFGVTHRDRVFALSELNFDLSVYDIFGTLAAGGALVIPEAGRRKDPSHWLELMVRERVTIWNSVPALMQMLVEHAASRPDQPVAPLRLALLSGDWIPLDLPERIRHLTKDTTIIGLGGATEASIWSVLYPIGEVDAAWKSIPYGYPMKNQRLYVLGSSLEQRPDWAVGQIYIGGLGLAKGYWKDKTKTDASFVVHPVTGERLYRTGDLGRFTPHGSIEFLGREDSQVKIGGYRIELGEIETTLLGHPEVREAAVVVSGTAQGNGRLVGYVVAGNGSGLTSESLRAFVGQKLPDYMVPPAVIRLDKLPLTPNGKLDKKQLARDAARHLEANRPPRVLPRDATEKQVAAIWRDLLKCEHVGVHDNFFEMGGNSLLALRLHARLQEHALRELSIVNIFEYPTVNALARFMAANQDAGADTARTTRRGGQRRERMQNALRGRQQTA